MGAYIRVDVGRYLAGFALIDAGRAVETQSFPAPPDESEAGRLGELYVRVSDLIEHWNPDLLALKVSEIQKLSSSLIAHRAEGIVLGAAGRRRALPVTTWICQGMYTTAGFTKRPRNPAVIEALCDTVSGVPADDEVRQATAAAVVAVAKHA